MKALYATKGHTYMAGANKPFFVSAGMIVSAAEGKGFTDVKVTARGGYPASSVPPLPPGTPDDWDVLGTGVRSSPSAQVELPDRVRWVVDVTPAARPDPNFEPGPAPAGGRAGSFLPPVYPTPIPAGVDWTVAPSGRLTMVFWAAALGLLGTLAAISWKSGAVL